MSSTDTGSIIVPPRIRILPPDVVQQIAAGEVIERPASVIKELVENSIDAGSRKISVAVRGAPDRLLRVLDDGCGMSEEEAHLALKRHATSKLLTADDLARVRTLGFRGEALPTIAQVSRLTLSTRAQSNLGGVQIEVAGGAILTVGAVGRPPGTTVTVADLFFNTPARRKFLRSARGEMRAILRLLTSYALVLPGVHFLLSENDKEALNLPPVSGLRARAAALYGGELADELIEVNYGNELLEVHGLVGGFDVHRGNRDHQTFVVNGRWVQNPLLGHAVRTAYRNRIPSGRFPFAILEIALDPAFVDVNVHPTKREIKFSREHEVYGSLMRSVEAALRAASPPPLGLQAGMGRLLRSGREPVLEAREQFSLARDLAPLRFDLGSIAGRGTTSQAPAASGAEAAAEALAAAPAAKATPAPDWEGKPGELVPLWQLDHTYVFCPVKGGVLIVDQHVAHERVIYERALAQLRESEAPSQVQLFPEDIELAPADLDLLVEALPWLDRLGFDLRVLGERSVTVKGVPARLDRWRRGRFLHDLIESVSRERRGGAGLEEAVAASYACHAAVRKGDPMNLAEMNRLVEDLFACEMPLACPHGRTIVVKLTLDELDRRFGRA
jgi:DNA mismatch repair protein MutL